jgi:hypothetical protein
MLRERGDLMRERLLGIERDLIEAISDARTFEPHDENWRSFVTRLDSAKSAIWHAMDEQPWPLAGR